MTRTRTTQSGGVDFKSDDKNDNKDDDEDKDWGDVMAVLGRGKSRMLLGAFVGGGDVHSNNNDNDVTNRDEDHKDDNNNADTQQPTLWSDAFQAERGWSDFGDNDYVNDKDEPQQGQGQQ